MNTTDTARGDRLYALLPVIHRMRDAERGYPLKALLAVIAEQVNVVEDDIARLYENWFIETAEDWAVPYIGDLVGYRPAPEAGPPADSPACPGSRILVPRREVANLIRYRRRKGTLALLEELARELADWPARAVEFYKLLGWSQNLDHQHPHRHQLADLRSAGALELLGGPFDAITRSVDLRRPDSQRTRGRSNIPGVGLFLWRLKSYPVTQTPAYCLEESGPHCFSFSVLGQDAPLFAAPPADAATHSPGELDVPAPIRRRAFDERIGDYYGPGKSLQIWTEGWAGWKSDQPVPAAQLVPADLSDWKYVPKLKTIAVDPVLGRLAFPPSQLPKKGVRVSYCYGFPADLGGGEYARPMLQPARDFTLYRVGTDETLHRIADALQHWQQDKPANAIIELADSGVYVEPLSIQLGDNQTLELRAADRARPVLRMIDYQTDQPDALAVTLGAGSRFTLDGLLVTGRPVQINGTREVPDRGTICPAEVVIRHCTLVPGWGLDCDCSPKRPAEPSLEFTNVRARVRIEHSILGSIQIHEDETRLDPIPLQIDNSIVDATDAAKQAIGAPGATWAHATATIRNCTVFGVVDVHAMQLGENSIFSGCVNVARRQLGCMRYCYVPTACRTPRRYRCQPDGVVAAVKERLQALGHVDAARQAAEIADEKLRVRPQFTAHRYGQAAYAQLADACAAEIKRGADDESEMGAFHDLFQPQREATLRARLAEYSPAGMDVGLFFVT
jgi:hypothetical protein